MRNSNEQTERPWREVNTSPLMNSGPSRLRPRGFLDQSSKLAKPLTQAHLWRVLLRGSKMDIETVIVSSKKFDKSFIQE
jgi:hypothetical protein